MPLVTTTKRARIKGVIVKADTTIEVSPELARELIERSVAVKAKSEQRPEASAREQRPEASNTK